MDALTAQTIRRLCERLEAFRLRGPIPALMAEVHLDASAEETQPLDGFEGALWASALRQLPNGDRLSRKLWLAADPAVVADFRNFCRDAGRVALQTLHAAGYRVGVGAADPTARWLWAVFELAELRLPGTFLRLDGDTVWRLGDGGVAVGEGVLAFPGPFASLAATVRNTRYWKLADVVEASIAALDIAQLHQETVAATPPTVAPSNARPARKPSTRKIDVDTALGKLETTFRKDLARELGSDTAADSAIIDAVYSLSAEHLAPMLKRIGCKTSAKTISRSMKYRSWGRYRRRSAAPAEDVDPGPAYSRSESDGEDSDDHNGDGSTIRLESGRRPTVADAADDAVDSGHLSRRAGGRGATRIRKTVAERAAEDAADQLARKAGVDLPPAE